MLIVSPQIDSMGKQTDTIQKKKVEKKLMSGVRLAYQWVNKNKTMMINAKRICKDSTVE